MRARIEKGQEERIAFFNGLIEEAVARLERCKIMLGEGKTADVCVVDQESSICLKTVIKSRIKENRISLRNGVNDEIEFLDKLSDREFLKSIGIDRKIVPSPLFSKQDAKYGFLFMENIKGPSLKDVIDRKDDLYKLPGSDFDWDAFFSGLDDIVAKLHKAGIYHRDLHAGNIMIENGLPVIIDFGNAYESYLSDENPYEE